MSVRRAARTERRWWDVARGFVGLLGLLALAFGVPAALITWVGWPLPDEVPSIDEVSTALRDSDISESFLVKALAFVCWLVWIELAASLIVETIAHGRGREAGQVPFGGGVQRAAARLVATVALLGALTTAKGAPEAAELVLRPLGVGSGTELVQDTGVKDGKDDETGTPEDPDLADPQATAPPPVYVVKWRDTLWGIAETYLGDPFRWPEIYEINRGRAQPDGRQLQDPDLIHPGWELELPADAIGLAEPPAPDPGPEPEPEADEDTEPDADHERVPGGGQSGSSGSGGAGPSGGSRSPEDPDARLGGMTLLEEEPPAGPTETTDLDYASGEPGMVLLPETAGTEDSDDEPLPSGPLLPGTGLGPGDDVAGPANRQRRRTYAHERVDGDES